MRRSTGRELVASAPGLFSSESQSFHDPKEKTIMMDMLRATGNAAFPLLILAAVTLWYSLRYLLNPRSRHLLVASAAAVGSLLLALLSAVVGFQLSVAFLPAGGDPVLALKGLSESLNAVVLALGTCLLATTLLSIGGWRSLRGARTGDEHRASEDLARA
jgi:hypothetical protein